MVLPFNIEHAEKAGEFARILYEARKNNELLVNERPIIINDAKLFAQAHADSRINYYVTSDRRSVNIQNTLLGKIKLDFTMIDIKTNHTEAFGVLDL